MPKYRSTKTVSNGKQRMMRKAVQLAGACALALPVMAVSTLMLDRPLVTPQIEVLRDSAAKPREWRATYANLDTMVTDTILDHAFKPVRLTNGEFLAKVTAADIADSFKDQRINVAMLRTKEHDRLARQAAQSASAAVVIARYGKRVEARKIAASNEIDLIQLASIGKGALDAISVATQAEKSTGPRPVFAPVHLAYARAHPEITKKQAMPKPTNKKAMSASKKQLWCLATGIYFEARGESYRGQVAVAQVIMNRTKHKAYPRTICGVVFQNQTKRNRCQFSFACDGKPERVNNQKLWAQANDIAKKVVRGKLYLSEVANSTHYHATYVRPKWARKLKRMTKIGLHIFYRFKHS